MATPSCGELRVASRAGGFFPGRNRITIYGSTLQPIVSLCAILTIGGGVLRYHVPGGRMSELPLRQLLAESEVLRNILSPFRC